MKARFFAALDQTPTPGELEAASQRTVFSLLVLMVVALAGGYTVAHFLAGRHAYAALTALMLVAALVTAAHALRTRRFAWPLRLLTGSVAAALAFATLRQGPELPAAGWWLSVMPFLLAAGGLYRMALVTVAAFLGITTLLFVAGPAPLGALPPEESVSVYRRYAAVAGSELLALVLIVVSMRLRGRVVAALESARLEALEAGAIKARFLANMSHEIRAPLTGIVGVADMLGSPGLSEAQRSQLLALQRQSASTLLALINDILDAAKLDAGRVVLEAVPVDLRLIAIEVNELFSMQAFGKGIELSSSCSPDLPGSVIGDPVRIRQIVTNLVGNAVKFTASGGVHLHIALEPAGDGADVPAATIRIEVTDSGPGIPAEQLALLFRPFVQADASVTRQHGGTGLGLSISADLCRLMGGGISVDSEVGRGSTFVAHLQLPPSGAARTPRVPRRRPDVLVAAASDGLERHVKSLLHTLDVDPVMLRRLPAPADAATPGLLLVDAPLLKLPDAERLLAAHRRAGHTVVVLAPLGADGIAGGGGLARLVYKPVQRRALEELLYPPPADGSTAPAVAPHRPWAGAAVLVADDNPVNQIVVQEMLSALSLRPTVVDNGRDALQALTGQRFALVLMDVDMPAMNGLDATRAWRAIERSQQRPPVPVLAMTASTEDEDGPGCIAAGMDGFLAKPFTLQQLQSALERHAVQALPAA